MESSRGDVFWKKFPGLVWSNSKAGDSVMIIAALPRPRFHEILAVCEEFGLDRVWKSGGSCRPKAFRRPVKMVSSILDNLAIRLKKARENGLNLIQF